jgi:transglutaminase-like putative cysteine protease
MFQRRDQAPAAPATASWRKFVPFTWEEIVTLAIFLVGFFLVVNSIDSADWVRLMPSLYPISLLGLILGVGLAKTRLPEAAAHLTALAVGFVATVIAASAKLEGSLPTRVGDLADRFWIWADALVTGGISNDNLPFVVLIVAMSYVTVYISAWSIFRWHNAWAGVVPGGLALLTNVSYLPGQNSFSVPLYLLCSIILIARMNVLRRAVTWRETRTAYPDLLSLYVLNVTTWVGIGLLVVAWVLPLSSGGGIFVSAWEKVTGPVVGPLNSLSRVFGAIDGQRSGPIHSFGSTLPLQGAISLGRSEVLRVETNEPGFLRAQTYDEYTAQGWKTGNSRITSGTWPALEPVANPEEAILQFREPRSITVTMTKRGGVILSAGSPLATDLESKIVFGPDPSDITSLRPEDRLNKGDTYTVDSTVSVASTGQLGEAGTAYPDWIAPYLQLPDDLPGEVRAKAIEVTTGTRSPYEQATAIELFLRGFAIDTKIEAAPPQDDSVAYFLFDAQRGYFDYHASAMVVMLRTLGVPARLATGYTVRLEDRVPDTNTYVIREGNAFSWPEVYFPGYGWIEFNPTPSEPTISRSAVDPQLPQTEVLPDFSLEDFQELTDDGLSSPAQSASQIDEIADTGSSRLFGQILLGLITAFLGITLAGGAVYQFVWQRGMAGLSYPMQIWEKTLRLGRWARIPSQPQQTPAEYVAALRRAVPEAGDLRPIKDAYVGARYGRKELAESEKEQLTAAWKVARNSLLRRIFKRR